ncbi:MAG: hypothetical protein IJX26_02080, partial [Clostridia bacterium]|nr:hypothetical protein [Clostridia bacterium]
KKDFESTTKYYCVSDDDKLVVEEKIGASSKLRNVKERLEKQEVERAEISLDNQILDSIVESTQINMPADMIEEETERLIKGMEQQLAYQGATLEDYATYIGKTVEVLKAEQAKVAERQCKGRLVLEKLIRQENLDITEADVDAKLTEFAQAQNKTLEEYKKNINEDMINRVANELIMKNLLDFLRANNTIK